MAKVKTALVQMSCGADKQQNLDKAIEKIKEAAAAGAQIFTSAMWKITIILN
jgi:N-carbamoylputrescine amidase